jgi:hypothetical protein
LLDSSRDCKCKFSGACRSCFVYNVNDCKEEGYDPDDDQIALIDKGFTLYPGSFSSEEYGIEETLCETDIDYVSDDLIIKHEGGY